jgi:hypothetical protein
MNQMYKNYGDSLLEDIADALCAGSNVLQWMAARKLHLNRIIIENSWDDVL